MKLKAKLDKEVIEFECKASEIKAISSVVKSLCFIVEPVNQLLDRIKNEINTDKNS